MLSMAATVQQAHSLKLTGKAAQVAICNAQESTESHSRAVVDNLAHQLNVRALTGSV
jgi:hypothetical protein